MKAQIITIGDEILIGQIVDTNSTYIAQQLNSIGFEISKISSISDNNEQIIETLSDAQNKVSLVITTGGLGPTKDDITKKAFCDYFNSKLVTNHEVKKQVIAYIEQRGKVPKEINFEQAKVPNNCEVIFNSAGTAPAMWFSKNKTIFISLPGIPYEMKIIMQESILPRLRKHFNLNKIIHKTIMTIGLPESVLAEIISDWEKNLQEKNIKLAYLPSPEALRLRLSISGEDTKQLENLLNNEIDTLKTIIPHNIFAFEQKYLQEVIGEILLQQNKTLSTAESCTGGNIAKLITSIAGCSAYYEGSVVAYSNEIKEKVLKVDKKLLIKYGAVSPQVVEAMAKGVMNLLNTDYAIASSGIAGPEGGTKEKPVGTVWLAVASKDKVISQKFNFGNLREVTVRKSTSFGLNMLRLLMKKDYY